MATFQKTWRCLAQTGGVPDVGPRALVERAAAIARILSPTFGFVPDPGASYAASARDSEIDYMGEYTRTRERLHGTADAGVRFEEVEACSTDAAGPSSSGSTCTVTIVGLPAGTALELRVVSTPPPFLSAGFVATATLEAPDDSAIAQAVALLDREFGAQEEARQR